MINNLTNVMQNSYVAATTAIAANILFAEVAVRVATFVVEFFDELVRLRLGSSLPNVVNTLMVITVLPSLIAGMNIALHKLLKLPFSPKIIAGISTATVISYITLRMMIEKNMANR